MLIRAEDNEAKIKERDISAALSFFEKRIRQYGEGMVQSAIDLESLKSEKCERELKHARGELELSYK